MGNKEESGKIRNLYDLSPMQAGMLFFSLLDAKSGAYIEQFVLALEGEIDALLFEESFNLLIERYDIFRTVFVHENLDEPVQVVFRKRTYNMPFADISHLSEQEIGEYLEDVKRNDIKRGFDLSKDLLMRAFLLKTGEKSYKLLWTFHHIIMDGWCTGIVYKDWTRLYLNVKSGESPGLEPVVQYRHYIKWLQQQDNTVGLTYWQEYLQGYEQQAGLPKLSSPLEAAAGENYRLEIFSFFLEDALSARLIEIARKNRVTPNLLFQALWGILLQNYNNTDDVVFGAVVSGRPARLEGIENMIGLFINTVPVRVKAGSETTLLLLLKKLYKDAAESRFYEYLPLAEVQANSLLKGRLIDHILVFENYPLHEEIKSVGSDIEQQLGFRVKEIEIREQTNYNFNILINPGRGFMLKFNYNALVYARELIERTALHFKQIVKQAINNPGIEIKDIEIITAEEKRQLLVGFNQTGTGFPRDKTIHKLFEEQAEKKPDNIAVFGMENGECGLGQNGKTSPLQSVHLTYRQFNHETDHLASVLIEQGAKPGTITGLLVERSIKMVTAIFGILKAGAAYLPIDPLYPFARKRYILADSAVRVLLTTRAVAEEVEKLSSLQFETVFIEECRGEPRVRPSLCSSSSSGSLAYVIYTSGSTGSPKGVLVEHKSVVNILAALQRFYPLEESDTYLLKTSYVFDVSVAELFGWFLAGGRLAILEKDGEKHPEKIIDTIEIAAVTHINFVPAMFNLFVDALDSRNVSRLSILKYIFAAGEALLPGLVNKFRRLKSEVILENIYGPTEGTVYSSKYSLCEWPGQGIVPIGKPMQNIRLTILGKDNGLQPIGVPGELGISGEGLARGYLNNPELTAEKFLASGGQGALFEKTAPWTPAKTFVDKTQRAVAMQSLASQHTDPGVGARRAVSTHHSSFITHHSDLLYKTGDLARWLPNGNIEFLGRIDHQVKLRGFRIELGEIENRLLSIEEVKEAVVVDRQDSTGQMNLCAYIVAERKAQSAEPVGANLVFAPGTSTSDLRDYLSHSLPDYMIPSYFVFMESIPLTSNGKVDRKALPLPEFEAGENYAAPRCEIEEKMVEIWSEILGVKKEVISIDDNFFELGGHSLKATITAAKIHQAFNIKVPLTGIFKTPTIRDISSLIKTIQLASNQEIETDLETEEMVI